MKKQVLVSVDRGETRVALLEATGKPDAAKKPTRARKADPAEGYRVAELPVNHRPRAHGRSHYGVERYLRGFLDLLTVSFMGRYRHRPLHLFGALGLVLGLVGTVLLVYLTILKAMGEAIGHRPLLTLGVLLVVVGLQFFSLGLISELITSHHEERSADREREDLHVEEVLA